MAQTGKSQERDSTDGAKPVERSEKDTRADPIDPRAFGLMRAAYSVGETLDLLSISRTSLYAAVKRGDLEFVKFGKKTLFYATDLASFLTKLRRSSAQRSRPDGQAPSTSG
jgi:excisionase family DNA binding protein